MARRQHTWNPKTCEPRGHIFAGLPCGCKRIVGKSESPIESQLWEYLEPMGFIQQMQVGPYRLDFAKGNICIEADGHAFHQKTKAQAAADAKRDRWLTIHGWRILRFTGSEIHANAAACAEEIQELVTAQK